MASTRWTEAADLGPVGRRNQAIELADDLLGLQEQIERHDQVGHKEQHRLERRKNEVRYRRGQAAPDIGEEIDHRLLDLGEIDRHPAQIDRLAEGHAIDADNQIGDQAIAQVGVLIGQKRPEKAHQPVDQQADRDIQRPDP